MKSSLSDWNYGKTLLITAILAEFGLLALIGWVVRAGRRSFH